jgi:hypothetical protein
VDPGLLKPQLGIPQLQVFVVVADEAQHPSAVKIRHKFVLLDGLAARRSLNPSARTPIVLRILIAVDRNRV